MAASIDASIDLRDVDKMLKDIIESAPKGSSSALNRAIASGKSRASHLIRQTYTIKKADVDSKMSLKKSTPSILRARISVRSRPLSLTHFIAKWKRTMQGASIEIVKGTRKTIKGSFIAKGRFGGLQVYKRTTKKRLPLKALKTISPVEMVNSKNIRKDVEDYMVQQFTQQLLAYLKHKGIR